MTRNRSTRASKGQRRDLRRMVARVTVATLLLVSAGDADAQDRPPVERREAGFDAYKPIVEHNIFLRERGPRRAPPPAPSTRPATPERTPEQTWMLTGVVFEDGQIRAYFENLAAGTIQQVAPGEPIGRGHISEIMIDAVAYASEAGVQWVEIGHDLTGTAAVVATTTAPAGGSAPTAGGAASATTAPTATDGQAPANQSLVERMRQRAREGRAGGGRGN